jgi:hypothetical protein
MAITLREGLGRKLTIAEMDENFTFLSGSYVVNSITSSMTAGNASSASTAVLAQTASVAARANALASTVTATSASTAILAQTASVATRANGLAPTVTATSASVAARATTLSAQATASFADVAGTVHDGNITNAKLANDSVTIGSTEIDLGATATTLTGLTSISATTASFVLQTFESSSTVITSGSNIFGDKANDIQQITGSLLQTGSASIIGDVTASAGFSGSLYKGTNVTTTSGSIGDLTVTRITETSALEYKTDVRAMRGSDKIYQLRPVNFKWKEDQRKDVGLIAEEVVKIYPELVKTDGEGNAMGVNYSKLTAVLIKTVQDLKSRIEDLENK